MKIILLGASGQLGREWQYFFSQKNNDIVLLPYTSQQLDITHFDKVDREIKEQQPDVVINCAAYTKVDEAEEKRQLARKVNAEAVRHLAEICRDITCKLIHYSTDYVFPGRKRDRERNPEGYPEDYPVDPINWYGQTKWEGEEAVRGTLNDYLILRVSWLCGQFGNNFVRTMLKFGRERNHLKVVNDQWGSPTFTENVVRNTFVLIESGQTGTFHVTTTGLITWYDLAKTIFEIKEISIDLNTVTSDEFPTEAKRPFFSKLSTKKIEAVPDIVLRDWKTGLERLLHQLENR